jgi:hypothetical protein
MDLMEYYCIFFRLPRLCLINLYVIKRIARQLPAKRRAFRWQYKNILHMQPFHPPEAGLNSYGAQLTL